MKKATRIPRDKVYDAAYFTLRAMYISLENLFQGGDTDMDTDFSIGFSIGFGSNSVGFPITPETFEIVESALNHLMNYRREEFDGEKDMRDPYSVEPGTVEIFSLEQGLYLTAQLNGCGRKWVGGIIGDDLVMYDNWTDAHLMQNPAHSLDPYDRRVVWTSILPIVEKEYPGLYSNEEMAALKEKVQDIFADLDC